MHIHHVSLSTTDMARIISFYKTYFGAVEHSSMSNPRSGQASCLLEFDKGSLLEVTSRPAFVRRAVDPNCGFGHMAICAGDTDSVDFVVQRLEADGHSILSQPRLNGNGYYESTVLDPDGNWIEISSGRMEARLENMMAGETVL